MLITPIWPITTLAGNCERAFAATMTDGAKNEDPKPAIMKVIERMTSTSVLLEGTIRMHGRLRNPCCSEAINCEGLVVQ